MFKFDEEVFVKALQGAVGNRGQIEEAVEEIAKKGYDNVFMVGSGGTIALQHPVQYLLQTHSTVPVNSHVAAELLVMGAKQLSDKSLVILVSDSGTTSETVAAAKFVKEIGATTVSFVSRLGTPLADLSDYAFANEAKEGLYESFMTQLYLFTFALLDSRGEFPDYKQFADELKALPEALVKVKEWTDERAKAFAAKHRDTDYHMIVGSGILWGEAYLYAMCILEEMQWIRTKSIHAAEFFHGTLELIEQDTSVILFKGEDATRPLVERVERFVDQYTSDVTVFDTADYDLVGISEKFRGFLAPIVIDAALERVSKYLETERNHPLETRRYYKKVAY